MFVGITVFDVGNVDDVDDGIDNVVALESTKTIGSAGLSLAVLSLMLRSSLSLVLLCVNKTTSGDGGVKASGSISSSPRLCMV